MPLLWGMIIGIIACTPEPFDLSDTAILEGEAPPEWPEVIDPGPPCETDGGVFELPDVAPAGGRVRFSASALLQPVGVAERLEVAVYLADEDEVDADAYGSLSVDGGEGATIVEVSPVEQGRASVVLRFNRPGRHMVQGWLDAENGRTGHIEMVAFATQLPMWELALSEEHLTLIVDHPEERIKVPAELTIDQQVYGTTVRIHGGSSRYFPKKSFRFDLDKGLTLPDGSNHLILRAEWGDKAMLRNYLGLELSRFGTWLPTPRAQIVHFRINQRYYGAMWHVERIDGDFLRARQMNPDGSMYEADPQQEYWVPGGNLTPLLGMAEYVGVYDHKKGDLDYEDLIELIEETLTLPDREFVQVINQAVDVSSVLVYMAVMAVMQNQDHIKKNYYLYRNHFAEDDRWVVIPWDLDLTLGHLWTEENDILDETIFVDGSPYSGSWQGHDFFNRLLHRLWTIPELDARFWEYVDHIVEHVFTAEFIDARIDNVLCRAAPDIVADGRKRASLDEYLSRVDEIRSFVAARRMYLLSEQ